MTRQAIHTGTLGGSDSITANHPDRSAKTGGTGGHLTEFIISTPAETQGAENSGQADPLVINLDLEEIEVDAISIATLSDLDAEGLDY